ncbi:MAG: thioredoxin [Bacteriovoracaceae bacterium]|nr:thioredoxin [Bacteriovoracaceae bacterium]
MSVNVDQNNFDEIVKTDKPIVLDFWAEWCGPCKQLIPVLDEISNDLGEKAIVAKVNVDENPNLAQKFGIRGIPTLVFFKNGELKKTLVGVQPKQEIIKSLEELM